jgi:hypothetical protein
MTCRQFGKKRERQSYMHDLHITCSTFSLDLTCMTFFPMVSATLEQTTSHFCDALERRLNLVSGRDREGIIPEKQHLKTTHQEIRAK